MNQKTIISRNNNFDILRFVLAFIVVIVHIYDLTLYENLKLIKFFLNSKTAVQGFFIISGFLIFMSYERSKNLKEYIIKRFRRIYPAYFFVISFCSVFGYFLSELQFREYFSLDLFKYIFYNLIFLNFLQPFIPGVFENNPVMPAINGSLWTIKIEVMFYLLVPLIVWLLRKNKKHKLKIILLIYTLSYLYNISFLYISELTGRGVFKIIAKQVPGQLSFFISGALLYYYFDVFKKNKSLLVVLSIVTFSLSSINYLGFLKPISLAIIIFYISFSFPMFNGFGKYGDFSYGIYIFHFPIIQLLISYGFFKSNVYRDISIAIIIILLVSILSWNLLEKPFLKKRGLSPPEKSNYHSKKVEKTEDV